MTAQLDELERRLSPFVDGMDEDAISNVALIAHDALRLARSMEAWARSSAGVVSGASRQTDGPRDDHEPESIKREYNEASWAAWQAAQSSRPAAEPACPVCDGELLRFRECAKCGAELTFADDATHNKLVVRPAADVGEYSDEQIDRALKVFFGDEQDPRSSHQRIIENFRRAIATLPAKPAVTRIVFTANQAQALLDFFGGDCGKMTVAQFNPCKDEEGTDMPAGMYVYCTDYPEEGRSFLGEPDEDSKPDVLPLTAQGEPAKGDWGSKVDECERECLRDRRLDKHHRTPERDWNACVEYTEREIRGAFRVLRQALGTGGSKS